MLKRVLCILFVFALVVFLMYYNATNINTKQTYFAETLEEHEANLAKVDQQYAEAATAAEGE